MLIVFVVLLFALPICCVCVSVCAYSFILFVIVDFGFLFVVFVISDSLFCYF